MSECCQTNSCNPAKQKTGLKIALVGNPNGGKTTLFNALTGGKQKVGNWPGVTVECRSGFFAHDGVTYEVVDLPGIYSLGSQGAIDEQIACDYILNQEPNVVINILDASKLERHLYLTVQLLEMGLPVILALNMIDVARSQQIDINFKKLSEELQCPVIPINAYKGDGVKELKKELAHFKQKDWSGIQYPQSIIHAIQKLTSTLSNNEDTSPWLALRLLEGDIHAEERSAHFLSAVDALKAEIYTKDQEDADILIADARYQYIQQLTRNILSRQSTSKTTWTTKIDNIVLNRMLGIPIFLIVMYLLFFFSINIGGAFQDFFDITSQTIFVDGLSHGLQSLGSPTWLTALLANGIGKGINTTVTFIPVIGAMFLFLAFLEDSGYMARAAFVVDRLMRALGLPGKAFVPMIVGFGCNVPAVMGARTLENKRDRILTIMMSPFMSCGARLAIYAVFTAAFFPRGGQNIVFALYLIGILMAVITGLILRQTVLKGEPSPLVMELPIYHLPSSKTLCLHAWHRLKNFVFRAGKLIVPICVCIGALNSFNLDGTINTGNGDTESLLSFIGQSITPIFSPMGIHADNWPATVGLLTGVLAKEVVVGTLNTLYTQMGHMQMAGALSFDFLAGLESALRSIPDNFLALNQAFTNPILATAPIDTLNQGVYGLMYQKFDGQIGAFAYLLFVLLYFPCISTTAAMLRELHKAWSIFSVLWMTSVAYGVAVIFYQGATFLRHPYSSSLWIMTILFAFASTFLLIQWYAKRCDSPIGEMA